jgi:tetratricopeptide (TPR) repeat protein
MARAWEAPDGPELAVEAIRLWPGCAEAYLFLAAAVQGQPALNLALFTLAADAASDALGPEALEKERGSLWERPDGMTLLRSLEGLGRSYMALGALDLAVNHFAEVLDLNPNDDQGIRYPLAACLLEGQTPQPALDLLTIYEDGTVATAYLSALATFQKDGEAAARPLLAKALGLNPVIAEYLAGERTLPIEALDLQVPPALADAMIFAGLMAPAWEATPGALDWLKRWAKPEAPRAAPPSKERRSGPRSLD